MKTSILFIQTGGTIDKKYPQKPGAYGFEIEDAAFLRILSKANVNFDFEVITPFRKDSQEITEVDRIELIEICKNTGHSHIIITHGTDTMIDTAKFLGRLTQKTIVLTGAHLPECVKESDADFNLGVAVGAIFYLPNGVYCSMNGVLESVKSFL